MKFILNNAVRNKLETVFKILLLVYLFLGTCNLTYGTPIISLVMYPTFLLGGLLVLWRLLVAKRFIKFPGLIWLVLMLVSYVFSAVMNFRYIGKNSIVVLILWSFYFLLVFVKDPDRKRVDIEHEIRFISTFYLICVTALTLISHWMLLTGYSLSYRDPNNANYEVASGFFAGRLWGAFQDPNLGSVMCDIAIVISVYYIWYLKKKILTVLLCADIGLMLFYIALSDSRNGMVTLGCLAAMALFFYSYRKYGKDKGFKGFLKKAACVIAAGVVFVGGAATPKLIQKAYNAVLVEEALNNPSDDKGDKNENKPLLVDRGYDLKEDVSNRRLTIWQSGIEIAMMRPFTGVSFEGLLPFAKEYVPDSYLLTNGIWEFNTLDNDYLNIFVAQGFPGVIVLILLMITSIKILFCGIWKVSKKNFPIIFICTVIVCSLVVSALFQGTMFYQQTPNTMLFWLLLGSIVYLLSLKDEAQSDS